MLLATCTQRAFINFCSLHWTLKSAAPTRCNAKKSAICQTIDEYINTIDVEKPTQMWPHKSPIQNISQLLQSAYMISSIFFHRTISIINSIFTWLAIWQYPINRYNKFHFKFWCCSMKRINRVCMKCYGNMEVQTEYASIKMQDWMDSFCGYAVCSHGNICYWLGKKSIWFLCAICVIHCCYNRCKQSLGAQVVRHLISVRNAI